MADAAQQMPSDVRVLMMLMNMWGARAMAAVARFGVHDKVQEGPRSVDDIASELNVDAGSLFRLIRCVSRMGLINIDDNRIVSLADAGKCLLSNPGDGTPSMRDAAIAWTMAGHYQPWGDIEYSIRTGKPSTEVTLRKSLWQHYKDNLEEGTLFARSMTSLSSSLMAAVLEAYKFPEAGCIVDVGGSHGAVLKAILDADSKATGVLYDLPYILESADHSAYGDRITNFPGSFVEGPFPQVEADAFVLKHILHDWSDDESVTILRNIRNVVRKPTAKLVVMEFLIGDAQPGAPLDAACIMDMNTLLLGTGRERTADEFKNVFERAGWTLTKVVPTKSPLFVLEGTVAELPK